jgi:diaminohydroxyphosphoribosylaminopyrimidine deaminase/5-amino-6-(5-phosphoribosylamino)uracil reductase
VKVTLKLATSLDGRIATASGESRWITGPAAREQVHRLRAMHQSVLVGVSTAIADDPQLNVRMPGYVGLQPLRVVLDSRQRLPSDTHLVREAERLPTLVVATTDPNKRLTDAGVTVVKVAASEGWPDLGEALKAIAGVQAGHLSSVAKGVDTSLAARSGSVLIEGGGQVAASFLRAGLVDAIEWFRAPMVLGDEGRPAVGDIPLDRLADAPRFRRVAVQELDDDLWERYERR